MKLMTCMMALAALAMTTDARRLLSGCSSPDIWPPTWAEIACHIKGCIQKAPGRADDCKHGVQQVIDGVEGNLVPGEACDWLNTWKDDKLKYNIDTCARLMDLDCIKSWEKKGQGPCLKLIDAKLGMWWPITCVKLWDLYGNETDYNRRTNSWGKSGQKDSTFTDNEGFFEYMTSCGKPTPQLGRR